MFKIFKNRVYLCVFTAVILCFTQTVGLKANAVKGVFQDNTPVVIVVEGENAIIEAMDMAVIRVPSYSAGEKSGAFYGKVEKVSMSLFSAFWGAVGIVTTLFFWAKGEFFAAIISLIGVAI
ncbi:hypothetical protein [Bartonella gliris]|uniref:hypothetical protein n=1 Tax=Bartonella gliris TaxID=3004109 RepID=UPI003872DBBB